MYSAQMRWYLDKDWLAELSRASVCEAESPGIDSRRRQWCFFWKMVIARMVAEKEKKEEETREGREKSKEERTEKEKNFFF